MDENEPDLEHIEENVEESTSKSAVEEIINESIDTESTENAEVPGVTNTNVKKNGNSGLIILIALIAVVVLLLIFGKNNKDSIKKLAGTYEIVEMSEEGEDVSENLNMLKALGMEIKLDLREDGTGTIDLMGEKSDLTFNSVSMIVDGDSQTYTVDKDGRISMESSDGTKMVFARIEENTVEENKVEENTNTNTNTIDSIEDEKDVGIVGNYKVVEMSDNEGDLTPQLAQMEEQGLTIIMELKEDGKGTINAFGDNVDFTYDDKYFIIEEDKSPYSIEDNGRITLQDSEENGGTVMVFEKVTDDVE